MPVKETGRFPYNIRLQKHFHLKCSLDILREKKQRENTKCEI